MHDGAGHRAELVTASQAVPLRPSLDGGNIGIAATGAAYAVRPAQLLQLLTAFLIAAEAVQ